MKDEDTGCVLQKITTLKQNIQDLAVRNAKLGLEPYLLRWLLAYGMDVRRTEEAIRANVLWRRENDIDSLVSKDLSQDLTEKMPMYLDFTHDPPVVYTEVALTDIPALLQEFGKPRLTRHLVHLIVKAEDALCQRDVKWTGELNISTARRSGVVCISDSKGFSLKHVCSLGVLQFYLEWSKMLVTHFPTVGNTAVVLNVNKFVEIGVRFVQPVFRGKNIQLITCTKGDDKATNILGTFVEPEYFKKLQDWGKEEPAKFIFKL